MSRFTELSWSQSFAQNFPLDRELLPGSRVVRGVYGSIVEPTPVPFPRLLAWVDQLGESFGIERPLEYSQDLQVLSGNSLIQGVRPVAVCYGGHQFGSWAGQLGDGRAMTLGEAPDRLGRSHEFQLKGAGPTPYSRRGDGRAVLRSSLREFVMSEAMHHLGVPTTRALALVETGEVVVRDPFYDGHPREEIGAIVCRVAPSFLRFGNFEIFASRGERDLLMKLFKETIHHHFPNLRSEGDEVATQWFSEVAERTAFLMAEWLRVGFVHGVMNTDNLSVLGLTIDYGPFGWVEEFDLAWTPNTTDLPGRRYAFGRQPQVAKWNLERLAEVLGWLFPEEETKLADVVSQFDRRFLEFHSQKRAAKLGLKQLPSGEDADIFLVELDQLMSESHCDMTLFYRKLSDFNEEDMTWSGWGSFLLEVSYLKTLPSDLLVKWQRWFEAYVHIRRNMSGFVAQAKERMQQVNPVYVPRNYLLHQAIEEAEAGRLGELQNLIELFKDPYVRRDCFRRYEEKRPDWARDKPGCSTLSCSS